MKLRPREIEAFLRDPPPGLRAALIYGPDAGLVRLRGRALASRIAGEDNDFRHRRLSPEALAENPHLLAQEAASPVLGGGRAAIRVSGAEEKAARALEELLRTPQNSQEDGVVILEAGPLAPRSKLRQLAEREKACAALACYADSPAQLAQLARSRLRARGLTIDPGALEFLVGRLGADRGVSESEIEKLILYCGGFGPHEGQKTISLQMVEAATGDGGMSGIEDAVYACAGGEMAGLGRALARLEGGGVSPAALIAAAQRHFQRLYFAAGEQAQGRSAEEIAAGFRPPLHFSRVPPFVRQCRVWPQARAAAACRALWQTAAAQRRTGAPGQTLAHQALFALAIYARRRTHRPPGAPGGAGGRESRRARSSS